jgi:hypothetical protein
MGGFSNNPMLQGGGDFSGGLPPEIARRKNGLMAAIMAIPEDQDSGMGTGGQQPNRDAGGMGGETAPKFDRIEDDHTPHPQGGDLPEGGELRLRDMIAMGTQGAPSPLNAPEGQPEAMEGGERRLRDMIATGAAQGQGQGQGTLRNQMAASGAAPQGQSQGQPKSLLKKIGGGLLHGLEGATIGNRPKPINTVNPEDSASLQNLERQYDQQHNSGRKRSLLENIGLALLARYRIPLGQILEQSDADKSAQEKSLLGEITAGQRLQQQENLETQRMTLQERMQADREKAQQASQERLFGQQTQLENTRDQARQAASTQAQQASETRLSEQIKAQGERQQSSEDAAAARQQSSEEAAAKRQEAMFRQQQTLLSQRESNQKASADETRRADLARNMSENLDQLEEIAKRRPELFGAVRGRMTQLKSYIGTGDPDVARLNAIHEYLGMASVGAHAMRNAQHVGAAADAVMAGYKNSPEAILSAIKTARESIATFQQDAGQQPGSAPKSQAQPAAKPAGGAKLKDRVGGKVLVEGKDF